MKFLKLIAALLDYPTELTVGLLEEAASIAAASTFASASPRKAVDRFVAAERGKPLSQWQEEYVQTFDYSTPTSLNLFEHVHGNDRERGGAMAELIETYRAEGLEMANRELPDHLPVFLEFLSTLSDPKKASGYLTDIRPILENLQKALSKSRSPYAFLISALL